MKKTAYLSILLLTLGLFGCGGGGGGATTDDTGGSSTDSTAPRVSSQSPSTRVIDQTVVIKLVFDESIDTTSVSLSSNLADESDGGAWSQTNEIDDTLTISPTSSWSVNTNRTLIINARDLAGNAMAELTIKHDVYSGTLYYVSSTASDDSGDGLTPGSAKHTIMAAINAATPPATVLVNAGDYPVSDTGTARVELVEGVSLYGGYSADFSTRTAGSSVISDQSTAPGTLANPNFVLIGGTGITSATIIDGFTLQGTSQTGVSFSSAIRMRFGAAATVQNNTLNGGSAGSSFSSSYGMYNVSASPIVQNNTLNGGSAVSSYGMYNVSASPIVQNNTLLARVGIRNETSEPRISANKFAIDTPVFGLYCYGIQNTNSSPLIENNTIEIDKTTKNCAADYGIENRAGSQAVIHNNVIDAGWTDSEGYGIINIDSSPTISGNSINAGVGEVAALFGIGTYGTSSPTIIDNTINGGASYNTTGIYDAGSSIVSNNVINGGSAGTFGGGNHHAIQIANNTSMLGNTLVAYGYCIYEFNASADPTILQFNNFQSCGVLYRDEGSTDINDIDAVNSLGDISGGAIGNFIAAAITP